MIKYLLFLLINFAFYISWSQSPYAIIDATNINQKYLEHLIKIKVDSVRTSHQLKPLVNDSLLYVASLYHADYMASNTVLSHYEPDVQTANPQQRVDYFGGKNYAVGENVVKSHINKEVKTKTHGIYHTSTYDALANVLVIAWVNSPGHFKNITTPSYQVTGVSIAFDHENGVVYACQKFAKVYYRYQFEESKQFFPYSTYVPEPIVEDFTSSEQQLTKHKHEWGLKHDKLEACDECADLFMVSPGLTLRYERKKFILRIENAEYVKEFLQNRKDGFAVEIVEYEDYACGNPVYYTKSSRRNGECRLNGRVLEPLYAKDLLKGFKKKKVKKNMRYLSYILGADSVRFVDRFWRYKYDKFTSQYFEISLGKLPKDVSGLWNHNLVYIKDKQVCHISYFTQYCGELPLAYYPTRFMPPDSAGEYGFHLDYRYYTFKIPFEKNEYELSGEAIDKQLDRGLADHYRLDSINIVAYSSVEGDSTSNARLQERRAQSIVDYLSSTQDQEVNYTIETKLNWDQLLFALSGSKKYDHLIRLSRKELLEKINNGYSDSLEPILKKTRMADVALHYSIDYSSNDLVYFVKEEQKFLLDTIRNSRMDPKRYQFALSKYQQFYQFVFGKVLQGELPTSIFTSLKLPSGFENSADLAQAYILFGNYFKDISLEEQRKIDQLTFDLMENRTPELWASFIYNYCLGRFLEMQSATSPKKEDVQKLFDWLSYLKKHYEVSEFMQNHIDELVYNLNIILLNKVYPSSDDHTFEDVKMSLGQVSFISDKYGWKDDSLAFDIAKTAVYYQHADFAADELAPFLSNEELLIYATPLYYHHPAFHVNIDFYSYVKALASQLPTEKWCNLFINECTIPFQAFDDDELRKLFCEKCMEENEFLKTLE